MTISEAYLLGRKDEKERATSLCHNPRSICIRCTNRLKCPNADTGAYVSVCKDFNLTSVIAPYSSMQNVNSENILNYAK